MDDINPLDALVGLGLLGFGVLLGYTTWKNVPGGAIGALKTALSTGALINGASVNPPINNPNGTPVAPNAPGVHTSGNAGQPSNARLG